MGRTWTIDLAHRGALLVSETVTTDAVRVVEVVLPDDSAVLLLPGEAIEVLVALAEAVGAVRAHQALDETVEMPRRRPAPARRSRDRKGSRG